MITIFIIIFSIGFLIFVGGGINNATNKNETNDKLWNISATLGSVGIIGIVASVLASIIK